MKKLIIFITMIFAFSSYSFAQDGFKYQGLATDNLNDPISNQQIGLKFSIIESSAGNCNGNSVYTETHKRNTNDKGLFWANIGQGTTTSGRFSNIEWENGQFCLQVEMDENGGNNYQFLGKSQLLAVPFSMYASKAGNVNWTKTGSDLYVDNLGVGIGTNKPTRDLSIADSDNNQVTNLALYNSEAKQMIYMSAADFGSLQTYGPNGLKNILFSVTTDSENKGSIGVYGENGDSKANLSVLDSDGGFLGLYGNNGKRNVQLTTLSGKPNNGWVSVNDDLGDHLAYMCILSDGRGYMKADVVSASIKNFVMDYPNKPNKEIVYACIEGPEAGAYDRGTSTLKNGEAFIYYSDHFKEVINSNTTTVTLTSHSTDTYGLAVVKKTKDGFLIKEMKDGTGNFNFDWEVRAVRKSYENYQPVRDKGELKPSIESNSKN